MNGPFKQGDYVILSLDPSSGKEIQKRRPCIVVSVSEFNKFSDFAIVCPITSTKKNSAFQIESDQNKTVTGWIDCDQLKSLDMVARHAQKLGQASNEVLEDVLAVVDSLIFPKSVK